MKILVTGTSRGLGFELIRHGLANGHTMIAGWFGKDDEAEGLRELQKNHPEHLEVVAMDVTSEQSVAKAAESVAHKLGSIDCIINNAGVLLESKFDTYDMLTELDIGMLRKTLEVNTVGTAVVLKYFAGMLYPSKEACIINITSEAGHLTPQGYTYLAYSVSKHAANMYTQKIRNYLNETPEKRHVRVYMVHPGRMNTVMGKENAQIEPKESAQGILKIAEGGISPNLEIPFINYKGEQMPF